MCTHPVTLTGFTRYCLAILLPFPTKSFSLSSALSLILPAEAPAVSLAPSPAGKTGSPLGGGHADL